MKPSELVTLLTRAFVSRLSILITGAPGIGKSDLVNLARREANADLIVSHPAVEDPTDAKGMPFIVDGSAEFLPFGQLRKARSAERLTVWFADDLGQASPAVQAAYMPLLDSTRGHNDLLGSGAEHIVFVAATNRRTDRSGVSGILEAVKSRFSSIVELEPNLDEWCSWAIGANVAPELIAFLRFQPDLLCKFEATADLTNSPMPRTWSHVSKILSLQLPKNVQATAITGAVGEGAATEFLAFLRIYQNLPNVDAILIDPDSTKVPTDPATLYALSGALAHRATPQNFDRIGRFVSRMQDAGSAEFGVLLLKDAIKRTPAVTQTQAFVKMAAGELGELING